MEDELNKIKVKMQTGQENIFQEIIEEIRQENKSAQEKNEALFTAIKEEIKTIKEKL